MTDLEQLARRLCDKTDDWYYEIFLEAITTAYAIGRASAISPARREASRLNGAKNTAGRKPGAKDKKPRIRRTKAQMLEEKQQEMK